VCEREKGDKDTMERHAEGMNISVYYSVLFLRHTRYNGKNRKWGKTENDVLFCCISEFCKVLEM
jgi:hypothetical protein